MMPERIIAAQRETIARLRWVVLVMSILIIIGGIAAPLVVVIAQRQAQRTTQTAISCVSARANVSQLEALREISDQLGVPVMFRVPEVPPECDGS
jgi:hypothetical protein